MSLDEIQRMIIVLASAFTLISIVIGVWRTVKELRLKIRAEARLAESTKAELDIKLLTFFPELMNIAHARGQTLLSEKAIEIILAHPSISQMDIAKNAGVVRSILEDGAILTSPVGNAAQDAAIAAIGALGKQHALLRPVAPTGTPILDRVQA